MWYVNKRNLLLWILKLKVGCFDAEVSVKY